MNGRRLTMRSVQPSATLESFEGVGVLKKLEMIARTCYKSEDKIMEGSAEKLIAALVQRQHYAMLEHHVFVFEITESTYCYLAGFTIIRPFFSPATFAT
jgi:thymidylate synthase ThyX